MAAAPDALAPPPGNPRFPLFDSLRAIAALSVVVTHAAGLSNFNLENGLGGFTARMNIGVTLFFLISGFLLYRPFVRAAHHAVPPPAVARFFRRRALRVLPAYWLALTLLAIWPGLVGPFGEDWYAYYGLLQIYSDAWVLGGIGPAWSLCIEVTFYLLLPFYALGMRRLYADGRERAVRREFAWLGGLAVLSLVIRTLLHVADDGSHFPNTLPGTFFWFALGMGLAVASVALEGREESVGAVRLVIRRPWAAWAAGAALFAFTSYALGLPRGFPAAYGEAAFLAEHILYGLVSLCVLLPAVFGDAAGGWPRRVLANPVLAWLGLISYGIYLWHFTLMSWLSDRGAQEWLPGLGMPSLTLAATAFSVVCAAASYYLVEKPLLRFKDPRPPSRSADSAPSPAAPPRRARLRSPAR